MHYREESSHEHQRSESDGRKRGPYFYARRTLVAAIFVWLIALALGLYHDVSIHKFQPYPWQLQAGLLAVGLTILVFMELQRERIDKTIATVNNSSQERTDAISAMGTAVESMATEVETLAKAQQKMVDSVARATQTLTDLQSQVERLCTSLEETKDWGIRINELEARAAQEHPSVKKLDDHR